MKSIFLKFSNLVKGLNRNDVTFSLFFKLVRVFQQVCQICVNVALIFSYLQSFLSCHFFKRCRFCIYFHGKVLLDRTFWRSSTIVSRNNSFIFLHQRSTKSFFAPTFTKFFWEFLLNAMETFHYRFTNNSITFLLKRSHFSPNRQFYLTFFRQIVTISWNIQRYTCVMHFLAHDLVWKWPLFSRNFFH